MKKKPLVFVTGAGGFLATVLIRELLKDGYRVIGHLRQRPHYKGIRHPQLTLLEAEQYTMPALTRQLEGVDHIIHAAGITRQDLLHRSEYEAFHVEATRVLLEAATHCGIPTFIYISTANAFGYGSINDPGTENRAAKEPYLSSFYAGSKLKAQQLVLQWPANMRRVVIAPTLMLGPGVIQRPSGALIRRACFQPFIVCPPGGKNVVHVDDVAGLVLAALERAPDRSVYLAAGVNISYHDFLQRLIQYTGQRSVIIKLPNVVLKVIGFVGDGIRKLGLRTNLSSVNMKILCIGNYYTAARAEQEFGIRFRSLDEILADSLVN